MGEDNKTFKLRVLQTIPEMNQTAKNTIIAK